MSTFAKTKLTGGSRQLFPLLAIRLVFKGALMKSLTDCAFSSICVNDVTPKRGRIYFVLAPGAPTIYRLRRDQSIADPPRASNYFRGAKQPSDGSALPSLNQASPNTWSKRSVPPSQGRCTLSASPRSGRCRHGFVRCPDHWLQTALCLRHRSARPQRPRLDQRHCKPDSRRDRARQRTEAFPWGWRSKISYPRSGSNL